MMVRRRWQRHYHSWRRLSWSAQGLCLEAAFCLGLTRLLVLTIPFRWIVALYGLEPSTTHVGLEPMAAVQIRRIRWAVQSISRHTPWDSNCLAQALAAATMLQRRRISSTLYLGVAKRDARRLDAHAWLRCGDAFVTGENGWQHFTVVATLQRPCLAQTS
jgi:hypothetical protein